MECWRQPSNNALKLTRGEGGSHSSGAPSRASRARGIMIRRAQLNAVFGGRGADRGRTVQRSLNILVLGTVMFVAQAVAEEPDASRPLAGHFASSYGFELDIPRGHEAGPSAV